MSIDAPGEALNGARIAIGALTAHLTGAVHPWSDGLLADMSRDATIGAFAFLIEALAHSYRLLAGDDAVEMIREAALAFEQEVSR